METPLPVSRFLPETSKDAREKIQPEDERLNYYRDLASRKLEELIARSRPHPVDVPAFFRGRIGFDRLAWIARTPGGRKALDHCERFAKDPMKTTAPFLTGPSGCGKSTIFWAMLQELFLRYLDQHTKLSLAAREDLEKREIKGEVDIVFSAPTIQMISTSGAELAAALRSSVGADAVDQEIAKWRQIDHSKNPPLRILVLDDLEVYRASDYLAEALYRIVDGRYQDALPTAYGSNLAPEELRRVVGDRVTRRILDMSEALTIGGQDV